MSHLRGGRTGLNMIHYVRAEFCGEYSGHHKGPPPGRDEGLLRKEGGRCQTTVWKRKMLFKFFVMPSLATRKKEMMLVSLLDRKVYVG